MVKETAGEREASHKKFEAAMNAHTNLSMWGAVVALCESGSFYPGHSHRAIERVIKIAQAEMQKHLTQMDKATGRTP